MDTIDVGGASAGGRPEMPPLVTVDELGAAISDDGYKLTSGAQSRPAPSEKVRRAVESTPMGRAQAAYPDTHPANREDAEQTADGALHLVPGMSAPSLPLGDIRAGYVTGTRDDQRNTPGALKQTESIGEAMADLQAEIQKVAPEEAITLSAHNEKGDAVIEVLFHLDIGVVVSYHTQVVEQGNWLIFVDDNTAPAKQKFIPTPSTEAAPIEITITGADGVQTTRHIKPLGINFTIGNYDFFVTMVKPEEE